MAKELIQRYVCRIYVWNFGKGRGPTDRTDGTSGHGHSPCARRYVRGTKADSEDERVFTLEEDAYVSVIPGIGYPGYTRGTEVYLGIRGYWVYFI